MLLYISSDPNEATNIENSDSLQDKFIRSLQERFPNDHTPPDGLIYQRIRYYGRLIDHETHPDRLWAVIASNHWWAILEKTDGSKKGKYLRAFLKHQSLPQAFDDLLPIPGIWEGMRIGLLHKVTSMRCDEVRAVPFTCSISKLAQILQPIMNYLRLIGTTFSYLMGGDDYLPLVDGVSVKLLQSRAPKVSAKDLAFLKTRMETGELFKEIENEARRCEIWNRLEGIDYPIPTLKTFFKDRLYLEVGRSVMQQLFVPNPERKLTIDEAVGEHWGTAVPMPTPFRQEMIRPDLYELWRFSFQYGFEMTDHKRRVIRPKPGNSRPSLRSMTERPATINRAVLWGHFFWLAGQRNIWPPLAGGFQAQEANLPAPLSQDYPENEEEIPIAQRCGKPFMYSVEADRYALTQESLEQTWTTPRITAGFISRSIFSAFFGYLNPNRHSTQDCPTESNNTATDNALHRDDLSSDIAVDMPNEMPHNPPNDHSEGHSDPMTDVYSAQEFNPLIASQQLLWENQQPPFFAINVSIPGEPIRELRLPNEQQTLSNFFGGLERHRFHIYIPGEDRRALHADWCYSVYERNPQQLLHADFLPECSFEQVGSTASGYTTRKRRRTDGIAELEAVKSWLQEQLAELQACNNAMQVPFQFSLDENTLEDI